MKSVYSQNLFKYKEFVTVIFFEYVCSSLEYRNQVRRVNQYQSVILLTFQNLFQLF